MSTLNSALQPTFDRSLPAPGEIWRIEGDRYGMIVESIAGQSATVMLLSGQTQFCSTIDLLIPAALSGLEQDLLAETWNVIFISIDCLRHRVGTRFSRRVYDLLLDWGDYHHGLTHQPPSIAQLQQAGLTIGKSAEDVQIQAFHRREASWSQQFDRAQLGEILLLEAALIEREFFQPPPTVLSHWLQAIFDPDWQAASGNLVWSIAIRSKSATPNSAAVTTLIHQIAIALDEHQRRIAIRQLGRVGVGDSDAIRSLVELRQATQDDETLWTIAESLWQLDPANSQGVRRVKQIDWADGSVALAIALLPKANQQVSILLQVYSIATPHLPAGLKLIVQDEGGELRREVAARTVDLYIQLKLSGKIGEAFSVSLVREDAKITEDFVI